MPDLAAALAARLEADIHAGRLAPGARLPTHRALATEHEVAVNTATRAMRLLAARGLAVGEVGRGSFVRAPAQAAAAAFRPEPAADGIIDLSRNTMPLPGLAARFKATALAVLSREPDLATYRATDMMLADRAAGAAWLARDGQHPNDPSRITVCAGAQHAVFVALMATTRPGDTVGVEALTWPGIKAAAAALHLRLVPIPMDDRGLRPSALLRIAARHGIRAVYCMPGPQNPTSAIMPQERRETIAALARRLDFQIIESDVYGFLNELPLTPLAALAPERTWFVYGTSKAFAPGLRCAWLLTPPERTEQAEDLVRATVWTVPSLGAAMASRWIADGTAQSLVRARREEARLRQAIAARHLPPEMVRQTSPTSTHLWLHLPPSLRADYVAERARSAGVRLAPGSAFAIGRAPAALRISLGAAASKTDLETALGRLVQVILEVDGGPGKGR